MRKKVTIDKIRGETAKRGVEGTVNVLAAVAAGVGIAGRAVKGELGGEHDLVAQLAVVYELPAHLFAVAELVAVGGVDEVATRVDVAVEDGS